MAELGIFDATALRVAHCAVSAENSVAFVAIVTLRYIVSSVRNVAVYNTKNHQDQLLFWKASIAAKKT